MTEIISYQKNDIPEQIKKLQFDCKINDEVISDLEAMEESEEVREALKEAYAERKRLDDLTIKLLWEK